MKDVRKDEIERLQQDLNEIQKEYPDELSPMMLPPSACGQAALVHTWTVSFMPIGGMMSLVTMSLGNGSLNKEN